MDHELHDAATLRQSLEEGAPLAGQRWQGLDLTGLEEQLLAVRDLRDVAVLGGRYSPTLGEHLRAAGALVFPTPAGLPVDPYRGSLYHAQDLYDRLDQGYAACTDALGYAWARDTTVAHDPLNTALKAIHDDSMSDALAERLTGVPTVGVMGGHALVRGDDAYRDAAELAQTVRAAGLTVITGGGPGAMEAANLGASCTTPAQARAAIDDLTGTPGWDEGIDAWARAALNVAERHDLDPADSVSVPTWFYGHEPPNVFAGGIAKYFSNALREDVLLSCATAGVVVLPGAAGTVQEVFQQVTKLYYAPADAPLPPLVLVGQNYWTAHLPVHQLVAALGARRPMGRSVHLVSTPSEAARIVLAAQG